MLLLSNNMISSVRDSDIQIWIQVQRHSYDRVFTQNFGSPYIIIQCFQCRNSNGGMWIKVHKYVSISKEFQNSHCSMTAKVICEIHFLTNISDESDPIAWQAQYSVSCAVRSSSSRGLGLCLPLPWLLWARELASSAILSIKELSQNRSSKLSLNPIFSFPLPHTTPALPVHRLYYINTTASTAAPESRPPCISGAEINHQHN